RRAQLHSARLAAAPLRRDQGARRRGAPAVKPHVVRSSPAVSPARAAAARALEIEAAAVNDLVSRLDERFDRAVSLVLACQGKVVVTGMGKSGLVGQKIASTLASTGTPAFFLHPAEGIHGDLGMLHRRDLVIAISYSGETEEVVRLLPVLRRMGLPL